MVLPSGLWLFKLSLLLLSLGCSAVSDPVTPWTVAHQAPLSIGFPRQGYWNRLQFSSPGDLPDPGIELKCPALAGGLFISEQVLKQASLCKI